MHNRRKGFTLVELMMLLLVASLLIASALPVITKRHFKLPGSANHGAYMCYYAEDETDGNKIKLTETLWSGKNVQNEVWTHKGIGKCNFTPPKKASYFQISAIGGGGGGGDAGYSGGNLEAVVFEKEISPLLITREAMNGFIPTAGGDPSKDEFLAYAGQISSYARSLPSTAGGSLGYVTVDTFCPPSNWIGKPSCTDSSDYMTITYCKCRVKETTNETTGMTPRKLYNKLASKISSFFKDTLSWNPAKKGVVTGAAGGCNTRYYVNWYGWDYVSPVQKTGHQDDYECNCHNDCSGCPDPPAPTPGPVITPDTPKNNSGGHDRGGGQGSHHGYAAGIDQIFGLDKLLGSDDLLGTPTGFASCCNVVCDTCPGYDYTYTVPGHWGWVHVGGDYKNIPGAVVECNENEELYTLQYSYYETQHCSASSCSSWELKDLVPHTCSGGSGGSGADCISEKKAGGYDYSYEPEVTPNNFDTSALKNGASDNIGYQGDPLGSATAPDGWALCADIPTEGSCGSPSYAQTHLLQEGSIVATAKAMSASSGGTGAKRGMTTIHGFDSNTCTPGSAGTSGYCASDSDPTSITSSKGYNGYVLHHWYGTSEFEGKYNYKKTYDQNYLQYGNPGEPGVFKTVIVRSLSNADTTIHLGRGGSAGTLGQGGSGSKGSATTMGNIIKADGGRGGEGSKITDTDELPAYNKERWELEDFCYQKDKWLERDSAGNYLHPTEAAQIETAGKCNAFNSLKDYKFIRLEGNKLGAKPTPIGIATGILNFIFNTMDNSASVQKFSEYGRGGNGGGVEHTCWAGQKVINFDTKTLENSSVFPSQIPAACRYSFGTDKKWKNLPATNGVDGALLIRW